MPPSRFLLFGLALSLHEGLARADAAQTTDAALAPVASSPPVSPAQAIPSAHPVLLDLGAGTYFPTSLTVEGTLELPARILVQVDLGWMPSPYSNTIVDLLGAFSVLDATEQSLLKLAIQNSFVGRLAAGWRPFPKLGFEATIGYTLVAVGGGVSGADVIQAYLQAKGSSDTVPNDAGRQVPLEATLHNFQATLGWRFLLVKDKMWIRASLSYLQCIASSTGVSISSPRPAEQALVDKINSEIQGYLNPYFTEYVKVPVIGLTAGYRF